MKKIIFLCIVALIAAGCTNEKPAPSPDIYTIKSFRDIPGATAQEIAAIEELQAHGPLIYATSRTTELFERHDGTLGGYTTLFCDWLSGLFGITFQPEIQGLNDMLANLQSGGISFATLSDTPERRQYYFVTDPIAQRSVKRLRIEDSQSVSRINGGLPRYVFTQGSVLMDIAAEMLESGSYEAVIAPDEEIVYRMLKEGLADVFITTNNMEAAFDNYGGGIQVEDFFPLIFLPAVMVAERPELEPVISLVNKAIRSGAYRHLAELYRKGYEDYKRHKFILQLTDEERAYLRDNPVLPFATQYLSYPVSFYNEVEKKWEGVVFDVLDEMKLLTGFDFELVNSNTSDLPELLNLLEEGTAYFMPNLIQSEERRERFIWSNIMYLPDQFALLSKWSYPNIELNDIPYEKVGFASGSAYTDKFRSWFPNALYTVEYPNSIEAFNALDRGEVNLVMSSQSRLTALTNYYQFSDYKANFLFKEDFEASFGINKDQVILQSIIDKALPLINTERIMEQWVGRTYNMKDMQLRQQRPWLIGTIILSFVAFVLVLTLFINSNKKRKVILKQADELSALLEKTKSVSDYELTKYVLANKAMNAVLWDMDIPAGENIGEDTKIIFSNDFRNYFGYEDESDFPKLLSSWINRIHPEDKDRVLSALFAHINDRSGNTPLYDAEYRFMHKSGEYRYVRGIGATLRDTGGNPLKIAGSMEDIHEKVLMREALKQREEMLQVLNETAIVFLSRDNEELSDMMGKGVKLIADLWDLDAISVFRNSKKPDGLYATQVYSWEKESGGTSTPLPELQEISYNNLSPSLASIFKQGLPVNGPVSNMPPDEKNVLKQFGIRSVFAAPVFIDKELWGFVSFEDYKNERYFDETSAEIMRSAAFLCVNAIIHAESIKAYREQSIQLALAEKEKETEKTAQAILDAAPFGTNIWDSSNKIFYANNEIVRIFGLSCREDFSENYEKLFPEYQPNGMLSQDMAADALKKAFNEGYYRGEFINLNLKGETIPMECTFLRIKLNNEDAVIVYSRDLREQKAYLAEIENSRNAAEEASRAKSVFLANMSHEIRTPMNSIIGFTELALVNDDIHKIKNYLSKISESSEILLTLINDILDITKIESGKMELERIPFDLHDVFSYCRILMLPKAEEKGLELYCYAEPSTGKKMIGDPVKLRQALINILSNAVKFTNTGIIKFLASIKKVTKDSVTIYFEVKDSGIGMNPDQINKIFEPFIQADSSITRKFGGTGLGLSITKNIINMMGGELKVESAVDIGSKFSFEITFDTMDFDKDISSYKDKHYNLERPYFSGEVLVCEDNSMNQEMICEHLKRVGLKTIIAENGREGVDIILNRINENKPPFDLIFMDIHMPVMDGFETTARILELGVKTPVVAMTANVFTNDLDEYKKQGMLDCVSKPFTSQELWCVLLKYLTPVKITGAGIPEENEDALKKKLSLYFVKSNQNTYKDIINAVNSGDFVSAHRFLHNLKSNAGQIEEKILQETAAAAEELLKEGKNISDDHLSVLKNELDKILKKLNPLLAGDDVQTKRKYLDNDSIIKLLDKLEEILNDNNMECIDYLEEIRMIPGTEKLEYYIENFSFEDALVSLGEIKSTYKKDEGRL